MGLPVFREPTSVDSKSATDRDPSATARSSIRRQPSVRYSRHTVPPPREPPSLPRIGLANVFGRPMADAIRDASVTTGVLHNRGITQRQRHHAPSRTNASTQNARPDASEPRSTTTAFDASFFDVIPGSAEDLAHAQLLLNAPFDTLPHSEDLPEHLRPDSRHGSAEVSPRELEQLPPLRRMGNRSINDSPRDREPSSLRDEWRPASEFNDGLGDRERSWSPGAEDDHWETHLTTISPDALDLGGGSDTSSDDVIDNAPIIDGPLHPSTSALHLPASTSNPNHCDDEPEIENLESLVQRYREARTETGVTGLRTARALLRDMRGMLERLEARRGAELSARNREEVHAILERIRRFDAEVGRE